MTQHLNLLPEVKKTRDPALMAVVIWLMVLVGLLILWSVNAARLSAAREAEAASRVKLEQAEALLQTRLRDRGAELNAEIDTLRKRAEVAQQLLAKAESLGNPLGFAPLFATISRVGDERLWLSTVGVSGAGGTLKIEGKSLDQEAVLEYVARVNAALPARTQKLTQLEMIADPPLANSDGSPLNVTKFILR
ncbi:MAG: hypothetical protein IPG34_03520 [Rhodocyclaceae bacterium]|nr:hypothetical protein [Rhodocyclaceae bacterium]